MSLFNPFARLGDNYHNRNMIKHITVDSVIDSVSNKSRIIVRIIYQNDAQGALLPRTQEYYYATREEAHKAIDGFLTYRSN
jgi:hypothetical protein